MTHPIIKAFISGNNDAGGTIHALEIDSRAARIAELEQALRLNLGVAPDDPILLTPVEREIVTLRLENACLRDTEHAARLEGARAVMTRIAMAQLWDEGPDSEAKREAWVSETVERLEKGEK